MLPLHCVQASATAAGIGIAFMKHDVEGLSKNGDIAEAIKCRCLWCSCLVPDLSDHARPHALAHAQLPGGTWEGVPMLPVSALIDRAADTLIQLCFPCYADFEDRMGFAITSAWNLATKDIQQTLDGVCKKVSRLYAVHPLPA